MTSIVLTLRLAPQPSDRPMPQSDWLRSDNETLRTPHALKLSQAPPHSPNSPSTNGSEDDDDDEDPENTGVTHRVALTPFRTASDKTEGLAVFADRGHSGKSDLFECSQ